MLFACAALAIADRGARRISRQADPPDRAAGGRQRDRHRGAHPGLRAWAGSSAARPSSSRTSRAERSRSAWIYVAKSQPDGYTLAVGPIGAMAITRHMVAKLPYVIEKDFQPIALIVHGHLMLAVSPKSDIKSVKELIEKAKANPGKLTNASSSNGSPGHVGGELFKFMTGHADPARAVSGRRAGDQRPGRRARRSDVREPQWHLQRRQVRPGAGRSR